MKTQTDKKTKTRKTKSGSEKDYSVIEERFGIEVVVFNLADVDFSQKTKIALEEQKQADFRAVAVRKKIDIAKELQTKLGADAQIALNSADVLMTPGVTKHIVSVEGDAGILGGIIGGLTGKKGGTP